MRELHDITSNGIDGYMASNSPVEVQPRGNQVEGTHENRQPSLFRIMMESTEPPNGHLTYW